MFLLWLAGCTTQIPIDEQARLDSYAAHRDKLTELESWQLQGRIAMSMEKDAWSATLHWTQTDAEYELRLIAPLGRGSFELRGGNQGVTLRLQQNKVLRADNPETLLQDNFGWTVPVSGLQYWIRGIPEPDVKVKKMLLDEAGRISALEQAGWLVTYKQYSSQGVFELPGRIELANGKLKLRLVIKNWHI
ncbi:MAG: outer rane lipoprotein LolB [Gammaproteobacteria bacterium]|nr:outer rane lipoprotein LolB [Gammaproteobacteria bacterium]